MEVSERCEFPPIVNYDFNYFNKMVVWERCGITPMVRFICTKLYVYRSQCWLPIKWTAMGSYQPYFVLCVYWWSSIEIIFLRSQLLFRIEFCWGLGVCWYRLTCTNCYAYTSLDLWFLCGMILILFLINLSFWSFQLINGVNSCNNGHCSVYTVNCIRRFLLLTVYEGVTNRHAIASMHLYTRCEGSRCGV